MSKFFLSTDSTADLYQEEINALGCGFLPLTIAIERGGETKFLPDNFQTQQEYIDFFEMLKDKNNNGQTILSFTFIGSDGKEHDAWRIVDVPMSDSNEADANKTELEELSNIVFLALQIHSVLIGNSIGASSSGGTQQREMYELKKLLTVPTQRLLLKPYYVARDFNGWDEHLEWEIGQMTLTTLDRNKNGMEETKV